MKKYAILVAGGSGMRMQSLVPKQFLMLDERPVLFHTLEKFYNADLETELLVVLPKNHIASWEQLINGYSFPVRHRIIEGGETRFHSVKNGLDAIEGDGIVAIHDGVRPMVSENLINFLFDEADRVGNAVPCTPVNESMRTVSGAKNYPTDRNMYRLIQTPQVFRISQLKRAFEQPYTMMFTDEANVAESAGLEINLVAGEVHNIKITTREDLMMAEALLKSKEPRKEPLRKA
jgi:2-C-methyl-D-erythritol 4-phosphate cytidylyltransferase